MINAKHLKFYSVILAVLFGVIAMVVYCFSGQLTVYADEQKEIIYYDSLYGGSLGTETADNYILDIDSYEITEKVNYVNVPSFGNGDPSYKNCCGPITGLNVVGFYDRWYTNLIPNYDPGMVFADGTYHYFPDLAYPSTRSAFVNMFNYMKTGEVGGTTSDNFKSGLNTYVNNAGYDFSYSSFYAGEKTVNLNLLTTAINQGKIAAVFCSEYNYVYNIKTINNGSQIEVLKTNSTIPHMMMVYGYRTMKFYRDGVNFRTNTFLYVTSSDSTARLGYMQLDDFLKIDEALIFTIS